MKRRVLEKHLRALGWRFLREGSRHTVWTNGESEVVLPRHAEINEYTAKAILKLAGDRTI